MILDKFGNVIHLEENQSEYTCRPFFICPGKEDSELVRSLIERMDRECKENQIIKIELGDVTVTININYHPGGDGKALNTCTGISGKLHTYLLKYVITLCTLKP